MSVRQLINVSGGAVYQDGELLGRVVDGRMEVVLNYSSCRCGGIIRPHSMQDRHPRVMPGSLSHVIHAKVKRLSKKPKGGKA